MASVHGWQDTIVQNILINNEAFFLDVCSIKLELNFQSRGCKLSFGHIHVFLKFHTLLQNFIEIKKKKKKQRKNKMFICCLNVATAQMDVCMKGSSMGLHFCVPRTICNVFGGHPATIDCLWTKKLLAFMMTSEYTLCSYKTYRNSSSFNAS